MIEMALRRSSSAMTSGGAKRMMLTCVGLASFEKRESIIEAKVS